MAHAISLSFQGDPNVGLKAVATDSLCFIGKGFSKYSKKIEKTLGVPVFELGIYGTDLCGVFIVANSNGILVPSIIFDKEKTAIEAIAKKFKLKLGILETDLTAIGNNIVCNDKFAIVNSDYSTKEVKIIKETLGVKVKKIDLAELKLPGALGIITNKGAIFGQLLEDKDVKKVEKYLEIEIGLGTVNRGNPFMKSGLIANSNGFVIGSLTSGFETYRIDEALGFI